MTREEVLKLRNSFDSRSDEYYKLSRRLVVMDYQEKRRNDPDNMMTIFNGMILTSWGYDLEETWND